MLRRPGRGALARAVGRSAPRPHRFRRMAPPLTGKSLILHPPTEGEGSMKRILCSLLVATLPFGSALADAPKSKNAKVTLVYQHELPNVPGKSMKGVLVEYGPGGYSPGHTHPKSAFIHATVLEGAIPQSGKKRTGDDLRGGAGLLPPARQPPRRQRQCQRLKPARR